LYRIVKRFETESTVSTRNKGNSGRPRTVRTQVKILEIRQAQGPYAESFSLRL
jgi:hypothetical protein